MPREQYERSDSREYRDIPRRYDEYERDDGRNTISSKHGPYNDSPSRSLALSTIKPLGGPSISAKVTPVSSPIGRRGSREELTMSNNPSNHHNSGHSHHNSPTSLGLKELGKNGEADMKASSLTFINPSRPKSRGEELPAPAGLTAVRRGSGPSSVKEEVDLLSRSRHPQPAIRDVSEDELYGASRGHSSHKAILLPKSATNRVHPINEDFESHERLQQSSSQHYESSSKLHGTDSHHRVRGAEQVHHGSTHEHTERRRSREDVRDEGKIRSIWPLRQPTEGHETRDLHGDAHGCPVISNPSKNHQGEEFDNGRLLFPPNRLECLLESSDSLDDGPVNDRPSPRDMCNSAKLAKVVVGELNDSDSRLLSKKLRTRPAQLADLSGNHVINADDPRSPSAARTPAPLPAPASSKHQTLDDDQDEEAMQLPRRKLSREKTDSRLLSKKLGSKPSPLADLSDSHAVNAEDPRSPSAARTPAPPPASASSKHLTLDDDQEEEAMQIPRGKVFRKTSLSKSRQVSSNDDFDEKVKRANISAASTRVSRAVKAAHKNSSAREGRRANKKGTSNVTQAPHEALSKLTVLAAKIFDTPASAIGTLGDDGKVRWSNIFGLDAYLGDVSQDGIIEERAETSILNWVLEDEDQEGCVSECDGSRNSYLKGYRLIKKGVGFVAGAVIQHGLSALVVFGPARDVFADEEKGLLLNMAQAASYHVDAMLSSAASKNSLTKADILIQILMADHGKVINSETSTEILNSVATFVRDGMSGCTAAILLKIKVDAEGTGTIVYASAGKTALRRGDERFNDLANKVIASHADGPLFIASHDKKTQNQMDKFIGKGTTRSLSTLIVGDGKPLAILTCCYLGRGGEDATKEELNLISNISKALSPLLLKVEAAEAVETVHKELGYIENAINAHNELFSYHLTPTVIVVYPTLPSIGREDGEGPTAAESVGVLCDFWNACEALAKKHSLKKIIRGGNTFVAIADVHGSGTSHDVAGFGLELISTVDDSNSDARVHVGVHTQPLPKDTTDMDTIWASFVSVAFQVASSIEDELLASDVFYNREKHHIYFKPGPTVFTRNHGILSTHIISGRANVASRQGPLSPTFPNGQKAKTSKGGCRVM
ncbi:hypothetical protein SeLEV6574_g06112 [Synchytrium endobioticum]|uniref:Uncharacterized protein n=1 Tax=Synchytrium endobioticum TaxID=286115 RepID=A0A507CQJ0_9FUNG|nr:hypothetical protein SeLEV6574_g06112 [Synchytrium endobioticum]